MMKLMKLKQWLGLLLIAFTAVTPLTAEEPAAPAAVEKVGPTVFPGKVVVIDKAAKTVTVEIKGQLYLFKINSSTKITKKDKKVSFADLLVGQEISLSISQSDTGEIELVSMTVLPGTVPTEAAGNDPVKGGTNPKKPNPVPPVRPQDSRPTVSPFN